MLHFSSLQRYLFWTRSLGPHQNPPKRRQILKHALLPASRPPAARLVTGERVPPRHHLLPASRPPAARLETTCCPPRDHLLPASTPASVYCLDTTCCPPRDRLACTAASSTTSTLRARRTAGTRSRGCRRRTSSTGWTTAHSPPSSRACKNASDVVLCHRRGAEGTEASDAVATPADV